jgi:hypothetical protein
MTRRRKLAIGGAAALVVAAFLAWYVGSPWWTLWRMREAARAGDWKTLASYVDQTAIRAAAKEDAKAGLLGALARAREAKTANERADAEALAREFRRQMRGGPEVSGTRWTPSRTDRPSSPRRCSV